MSLQQGAYRRLVRKPASVEEAFRIIKGKLTGDQESAQIFLSNMDTVERRIRGRQESREKTRATLFSKRGYPSLLAKVRNGRVIR